MAHNINSMMYQGETPWHGLGKKIENNLTAEQAIIEAGLDWKVEKKPIYFQEENNFQMIDKKFATVRQDTKQALGVVGNVYQPLQNKEAFSFFDGIVGIKEAIYHTAGALGKGERIWLLAKLNGIIRVVGDDILGKYLLLTNSHDGSSPVSIMFTPIRVVCQNTLNSAIGGSVNAFKIRHSSSIGDKVEDSRKALGIIDSKFLIFEEMAKKLATVQLTSQAWKDYAMSSVLNEKSKKKLSTRANNIMDEVTALFEGGQKGGNMQGVKGTMWGAYNAVVEYVDYHRTAKDLDSRANSILFGSGSGIKARAWSEAVAIVK